MLFDCRFGVEDVPQSLTEFDLLLLYHSLGVSENETSERGIRLEAVHIRGLDDMNTKDVFDYFRDYSPGRIEWIDDSSCNVVWEDTMTAARALLGLSKPISVITAQSKCNNTRNNTQTETQNNIQSSNNDETLNNVEKKVKETTKDKMEEKKIEEDDDDLDLMSTDEDEKEFKEKCKKDESKMDTDEPVDLENKAQDNVEVEKTDTKNEQEGKEEKKAWKPPSANSQEIPKNLPPGRWRLGVPHSRAENIFLRYATKADKKQPGAEKKSKYYVKYGNPNYGGMQGLISGSRKRRMLNQQYNEESEEARRAIHKKGIFDRLGPVTHRNDGSEEEMAPSVKKVGPTAEGSDEEPLVDEAELKQLLGASPRKRFRRMYADDEEEAIEARRHHYQRCDWAADSDSSDHDGTDVCLTDVRSRIRGRLRHRLGSPNRSAYRSSRYTGDLRSRLKHKKQYDSITVKVE